jgi:cystathionine gamma-synthase
MSLEFGEFLERTPGFNTRAIHAGQEPDPLTGAVIPPIYQTSTFVQDGINVLRNGHEYSRGSNPTRNGFETQLAALEGGVAGFAFASGIAAEDALLRAVLEPGDHIVLGADGYGGTNRLINQIYGRWGVTNTPVDITDLAAVRAAVRPGRTSVLWVETPSNPLLGIADIHGWAAAAHEAGAILVVDNTFASPYVQQPLRFGADVVVHSTTKYIGGHSDVLGGAVVVADREFKGQSLAAAVGFQQFAGGAVAGPQDCFLAARGLKTLGLRMERHSANALQLARWLEHQPEISTVLYPGLPGHPGHALARRQMSHFGGIVSIRFKGGALAARAFAESTQLFALSVSLGGVESLVCYSSEMTHASVQGTPLAVPADLVRLSVGVEDAADLKRDLARALSSVRAAVEQEKALRSTSMFAEATV